MTPSNTAGESRRRGTRAEGEGASGEVRTKRGALQRPPSACTLPAEIDRDPRKRARPPVPPGPGEGLESRDRLGLLREHRGLLELPREPVDLLGRSPHGLQAPVLAPAGNVRNRLP